jgi:hypothetical protein
MPGDLERRPAPISAVVPGSGPAALADELVGRVRAELPVIGELGKGDQVLVEAEDPAYRSAATVVFTEPGPAWMKARSA